MQPLPPVCCAYCSGIVPDGESVSTERPALAYCPSCGAGLAALPALYLPWNQPR